MFDVYFYGPIRVFVDQVTGSVMAAQDSISGDAALLRYSRAYVERAVRDAILAHESLYAEA